LIFFVFGNSNFNVMKVLLNFQNWIWKNVLLALNKYAWSTRSL
jgi:hypothetical protein